MKSFRSPLFLICLAALAAAPLAAQTQVELRGDLGPSKVALSPMPQRPDGAVAPVRAPEAAESADRWVVQVFCTPYAREARRVARRLSGEGYAVQVEPHRLGHVTLHRVRLGPLDRKAEAERLAVSIRERFSLDAWLTH